VSSKGLNAVTASTGIDIRWQIEGSELGWSPWLHLNGSCI